MERAAKAITRAITEEWSTHTPIVVFAGPGNNGGDALAVARLLINEGYKVNTFLFNITNHPIRRLCNKPPTFARQQACKGFYRNHCEV